MLLAQAREAVLAFITTQGRVPCPATVASNGQEAIASNAGGIITCTAQSGFLPAVTLGLPELAGNGLLLDAWRDGTGTARAIRYGTSSMAGSVTPNALTSPGLGLPSSTTRRGTVLGLITAGQGAFVCRRSAGIGVGPNRCGAAANTQADSAVAVIWSAGTNALNAASYSADELQNANQTIPRVYISRDFAPLGASAAVGGNFDDLVTWIPFSLMAERLLSAGHVL